MYNDLIIGGMLLAVVGLSFYAGYKYAYFRVIDSTLTVLQEDNIIQLVELPDGEIEVYSGTKFYRSGIDT
jgi:hypothetical protein|tara:strand:- start:638 stop:847 length:210 start_codon:yes stop_codon:yes gene_type:complete